MKSSCIALFIVVVSSIAYDNKWSDEPKVTKRIQIIKQKLDSFKQWTILSRKTFTAQTNNYCDKTNLGSELAMYKKYGCNQSDKSDYLTYFISLVGIALIILIFYYHIKYPDYYLSEYKDHHLWQNVDVNVN